MLFYVKKWIWLDLLVTVLLASLGIVGIRFFRLTPELRLDTVTLIQGITAFFITTLWTFIVQKGYAVVKGREFAENLTRSLAKYYTEASVVQAFFGALTASFGEELFFRGFIQSEWGLLAATTAFGLAHFGGKDIRTVSYWAFGHGLLFGLAFKITSNLAVPMIAHAMFDFGGILYFRNLMKRQPARA